MSELAFDRSLVPHYGVVEQLSSRIARLLAPNPGPFTFKGTGVYIVGAARSVGDSQSDQNKARSVDDSQSDQNNAVAVIDPGPDLPEHVDALNRALAGRKVSHILITHTHRDHSPAAAALKQSTGAKTYAFGPHPRNSEDVEAGGDRDFVPDVTVRDGDIIAGDGFTLECVFTPGHISNHMCYALKEERALFTGDHVMGWSTSVVAPPDGNMADYMRSLEKLIARGDDILYPTHGSPIPRPGAFLRASLTHRRMRAAQIRGSIAQGRDTIAAMVERLYADVSPDLRKAAALMVRAHLEQMRDEGRAGELGGRWRLL